ncbi:ArsB/NhaD family transporter [Paenibacillus cymbidii]|uniref:ArsB/NhaD family transporter n=1 Tax=Paenibacillus cymbidii TaxID=1639034 RepID=UPI0010811010|nr:ArsB/NhaD family transporter [Paenibacillus cymbidii]
MELVSQLEKWQVIAAAVIFLLCYALIVTEKINRAVIALAGALLMVVLGIVDLQAAYERHIEWQTIFLLVGMMLLVGIAARSGMFQYAAIKTAQAAGGNPTRILLLLSLMTAVGAALLDNVTVVLLMVPITIAIARVLHISPLPFLVSEIISANIGGTATLIGDPPNIMIGSATNLDFNDFLIHLGPPVVIILAVSLLLVVWAYRSHLLVSRIHQQELMNVDARAYIVDRKLMVKSLVVLALTLLGFFLHAVLHVEAAVVAVAGATLLMLIGVKEEELDETFRSVEWVTIFFFAGLFVLVGGLVESGIIGKLATSVMQVTEGNIAFTSLLILWISGIASATIDNIPFVATMIPLVQDIGVQMNATDTALEPVWWSLALGACLGGNGTLVGASANLIAAGIASREGYRITFVDFLKIGVPVTLVSLLVSTAYVAWVLV